MRIGIDATALPGQLFGAGNYIVNLVQALSRVDTRNDYVVFAKSPHAEHFASLNRVDLVRVSLPFRVQRIIWEQTLLPLLAHKSRLDVLHTPHYTISLAASCASVVTFHDMTFFLYPNVHQAYKRLFFRTLMPIAARRATALIAISESTCQDMTRVLAVPPAKISVIPYGIAPDFRPVPASMSADARRRFGLPNPCIVYVGNLEPRKNLVALLQAFARLVERGLPHSLVLVGSRGWHDDDIFSTSRSLRLADRVLFLGYVPQAELPAIYGAADAFIYPSLYEGFGLPLLEAMACGVPVVTSNVSSMPEVVADAGILVDPHSVDALADGLQRVVTDRSLHDELSRKGLERAKLFTWDRTARETLAVYERAAAR